MDSPTDIVVVEVSPRDGLQNEAVPVSTADKLRLIAAAAAARLRRVEVTSFVNPDKVPMMADAEAVVAGLEPASGVEPSALVLNIRGLERAIAAGIREVNAVVVCTETFSRRNQGTGIRESLDTLSGIMERAADADVHVAVTLGAAFGCPFEGEVPIARISDIAEKIANLAPREISLADTIGVAVPRDVRTRLAAVRSAVGDAVPLRCHFHNTRSTGIANALAAADDGVRVLDSSLAGLGGCPFAPKATGNIATEDLVYALERSGFRTGVDLDQLRQTGTWLESLFGRPLPSHVLHAGGFPPD